MSELTDDLRKLYVDLSTLYFRSDDIGKLPAGAGKTIRDAADRIAELEGQVITIKSCYENESMEHDKTKTQLADATARAEAAEAKLERVRKYADEWCDPYTYIPNGVECAEDVDDAIKGQTP